MGHHVCMVMDVIAAERDRVHERIAWSRAHVMELACRLIAGLERKNAWTLAEYAGGHCMNVKALGGTPVMRLVVGSGRVCCRVGWCGQVPAV